MAKEKTGIQKTAANIQKKSVFAFLKSRQTITMLAIFFILLAVFLISFFIGRKTKVLYNNFLIEKLLLKTC